MALNAQKFDRPKCCLFSGLELKGPGSISPKASESQKSTPLLDTQPNFTNNIKEIAMNFTGTGILEIEKRNSIVSGKDPASSSVDKRETVQTFFAYPEDKILKKILEQDNPGALVRQFPQEDFFWLVKKVDEDESLILLKIASNEQKQYLLDLETWRKDRLDLEKASVWLSRMSQADPEGLADWLFSDGEPLAYYYLFKNIQVEIRSEDDDHRDFGEDFFTLDSIFYIRVLEEDHRETIKNILRAMADKDGIQYQTILSTLAGVIPSELEEDMYRLRGVRLAEHGFLAPEEALAVYAPLGSDSLDVKAHDSHTIRLEEDLLELIPVSPLYHVQQENLLTTVFSGIKDPNLQDRLRLEFAGLCNQILSADGLMANDLDMLIRICQRAAGHLNLTLEKMCHGDQRQAEILLRNNSMVSLFRFGFGLVLKLKWEAEKWIKQSWFHTQGLGLTFWSKDWGQTLKGILEKKPQLYVGLVEEPPFRDFRDLSELDNTFALLHRLKVLDKFLGHLSRSYPIEEIDVEMSRLRFQPMLFNLWARQMLDLDPGFSAISEDRAKAFFSRLRAEETGPPFRMPGFEDAFIRHFLPFASGPEAKHGEELKNALSVVWQHFSEEYERVQTQDLEARFSKFILIAD